MLTTPGRRCWSRHADSVTANRRLWNRISSAYQHRHDPRIGATPRLWGMYSIPRPELGTPNDYSETDPPDWAHRWPAEVLWVTHKA